MQPLELELAVIARHHRDSRHCVSIVRGELRIERVAMLQQVSGAGKIGHVGRDLAREQRKVLVTADLRQLDLGVPVGSLYQPHGETSAAVTRQLRQPLQRRHGAARVGLHSQPETIPAFQLCVMRQPPEQLERQLQPVDFLCVDGQRHAARFRLLA